MENKQLDRKKSAFLSTRAIKANNPGIQTLIPNEIFFFGVLLSKCDWKLQWVTGLPLITTRLIAVSSITSRWREWKRGGKQQPGRFSRIYWKRCHHSKRSQKVISASYPKLKLSLTVDEVLCFVSFFSPSGKIRLERFFLNSVFINDQST